MLTMKVNVEHRESWPRLIVQRETKAFWSLAARAGRPASEAVEIKEIW